MVVGLYNRYGRLMTDLRRSLFKLSGGRGQWLDPYLREGRRMSAEKRRAWFADQYRHPHESKHTMGEVLGWFERVGLEYVRGLPSPSLENDDLETSNLFATTSRGSSAERLLVQLKQIASGSREGGFFLMIGRKPGVQQAPLQVGDSVAWP